LAAHGLSDGLDLEPHFVGGCGVCGRWREPAI
jgi:hypothetical protein